MLDDVSAVAQARTIVDCELSGEYQREVASASRVARILLEIDGVFGWSRAFGQQNASRLHPDMKETVQ